MVYVEEYGMKSITARDLADFCGCSTYSNDVLSTVYLLKDFFSIHESIRGIIAKSELDMNSLFKRPFFSYIKGHTKIKEEKLLELLWLNALGSLSSDNFSQDFFETMNAVWDKNEVTDEYLESILKEQLS